MDITQAVDALSALAHPGRLALFRLLVRAGPGGLPAGAIARHLGVAPNTLTAQLALLTGAGLASARREGRSIIYAAELGATRALLAFLIADCCGGRPEICAPLAELVASPCCGN